MAVSYFAGVGGTAFCSQRRVLLRDGGYLAVWNFRQCLDRLAGLMGTNRAARLGPIYFSPIRHSAGMNPETSASVLSVASAAEASASFEPLTYSVSETAQVLGVSLPTVYRLISRRMLKPLPGLRHKRVPKKQVVAFVNSAHSISV